MERTRNEANSFHCLCTNNNKRDIQRNEYTYILSDVKRQRLPACTRYNAGA
jgi:hypothetical protein